MLSYTSSTCFVRLIFFLCVWHKKEKYAIALPSTEEMNMSDIKGDEKNNDYFKREEEEEKKNQALLKGDEEEENSKGLPNGEEEEEDRTAFLNKEEDEENSKVLLNKEEDEENSKAFLNKEEDEENSKALHKGEEKEEVGFKLNSDEMKKFHIWPMGLIPYFIDYMSFDKVLRDKIRLFLDNINRLTGLRFMEIPFPPHDERSRWVMFVNRRGQLDCVDHPFNNFTDRGVQRVVLGYHCITADGGMSAVILSLVGVPPQHNSPDRDKQIIVKKENILRDKLHLFEKLKNNEWLFHDLKYDFQSAGHYSSRKYTANGRETILPQVSHGKLSRQYRIGEYKSLTNTDVLKIKMLYNYISRKRENPPDRPGCFKLFDPGAKLAETVLLKNKDVKPRKKPSKYLGGINKGEESGNGGQDQEEYTENNRSIKTDNENSEEMNDIDKAVSATNDIKKDSDTDNNNVNDEDIASENHDDNEHDNEKYIDKVNDKEKDTNEETNKKSKEVNKEGSNEKHDTKENEISAEKNIDTDVNSEVGNGKEKQTHGRPNNQNSIKNEVDRGFHNTSRQLLAQNIKQKREFILGRSDYETSEIYNK